MEKYERNTEALDISDGFIMCLFFVLLTSNLVLCSLHVSFSSNTLPKSSKCMYYESIKILYRCFCYLHLFGQLIIVTETSEHQYIRMVLFLLSSVFIL